MDNLSILERHFWLTNRRRDSPCRASVDPILLSDPVAPVLAVLVVIQQPESGDP